jgi:hypothetical protein
MTEHPAAVHHRSVTLVSHYRTGDMRALAVLLDEIGDDPELTGAAIVSLVQLASRVLDERPEDPDAWLRASLVTLSQATP